MYKFIEFFQKRPSDKTIRGLKIVIGLIILALLGIYFNDYTIPVVPAKYELYTKYAYFLLGLFPLIGGITGFCGGKRKTVRIMQGVMGILFIVIGNIITIKIPTVPVDVKPEVKTGSTVDFNTLTSKPTPPSKPLDIGFWIAWLSIFPLFWAITGKLITEKCWKHGEIIKKIRV